MKRNVWDTSEPFVQAQLEGRTIYLRTYAGSGSAPVVVEMDASEALALAIDLTNKARIIFDRLPTSKEAAR